MDERLGRPSLKNFSSLTAFFVVKDGIRVLGVDDASFEFESEDTFLTGVVYRGTEFVEDIQCVPVEVDGEDATRKVLRLYEKFSNHKQVKAILTDGISLAGFNLIDLDRLAVETGKAVVAVTKNRPDKEKFRETMKKTGNYDRKFEEFEEPRKTELKHGCCFIQFSGCSEECAKDFVRKNVIHGQVPESIRVADMVGRALNQKP
jgi:endonuclease V-like protein UPF0215 family